MIANFTRRNFLLTASAAGMGAALPMFSARRAQAQAKDAWGGFPVGVQSYSLRNFTLEEAIRHLQGMGVHYVELTGKHLPIDIADDKLAEVKKLLQAADVKISGHGVNAFSKDHEKNKSLFEFAKRAGIKTMSANPQPDKETFDSLDKLVAEYDIRIAIHNHGPGALYDKLDGVKKVLEGRDKRIGACVDCGHFLRSGEDPVKCVLELGPRVHGVHIKDERETNTKASSNVIVGKGHLDVVGLFKALRQVKFAPDGALSLEYEANPMNPIDDMKACLEVVKEAIAKTA